MPAALTPQEKRERIEAKAEASEAVVRGEGDRPQRRQRGVFNGTQGKLKVHGSIPGYHMHIFNDTAGRIENALSSGYEFVSPDEVGGTTTNVVSRNTDIGDKVRFLVGTDEQHQPLYAYLMKIRQDYYDEDQAEIQARNDRVDNAIKRGINPSSGPTEGFYVPEAGIKMGGSNKF